MFTLINAFSLTCDIARYQSPSHQPPLLSAEESDSEQWLRWFVLIKSMPEAGVFAVYLLRAQLNTARETQKKISPNLSLANRLLRRETQFGERRWLDTHSATI